MTPQEFRQLYESKDKAAEICYQLYQAYAKGDGVEADESQARKWLLAAHDSGMLSTRKEISTQPWRRKAKLKPSIKIAEVSDEEARKLGEELVLFMLDKGGRNLIGMNMLPENKPSRELVAGVKQRIAAGADLNVCVTEQNDMVAATALYLACKMGDEGLINMLLNHGADPNFHGSLALTAFYMPTRPKMNSSMPLLGGGAVSARDIKKMQKRDGKDGKNLEKRVRKLFQPLREERSRCARLEPRRLVAHLRCGECPPAGASLCLLIHESRFNFLCRRIQRLRMNCFKSAIKAVWGSSADREAAVFGRASMMRLMM